MLQSLKQAVREKNPDRLYIFWGEETFLLHHYLEQLRKSIVEELTESFNFHKAAGTNENDTPKIAMIATANTLDGNIGNKKAKLK